MGEVGQQASAAASAPALDRADRHVKDSRSVLDRVALHIDEHERGALLEGQLCQRGGDVEPQLSLWSMVWACRQYAAGRSLCLLVRQRHRRPHLTAPDAIQAGVDHDAVQPCRHRGVTAERVRSSESRDECILYRVRRLLRIAKSTESDRPQPVTVAADELAERVRVTVQMSGEQYLVGRIGVRDRRLTPPANPEP
jgi:hypothetical protein